MEFCFLRGWWCEIGNQRRRFCEAHFGWGGRGGGKPGAPGASEEPGQPPVGGLFSTTSNSTFRGRSGRTGKSSTSQGESRKTSHILTRLSENLIRGDLGGAWNGDVEGLDRGKHEIVSEELFSELKTERKLMLPTRQRALKIEDLGLSNGL